MESPSGLRVATSALGLDLGVQVKAGVHGCSGEEGSLVLGLGRGLSLKWPHINTSTISMFVYLYLLA